MKIRKDTLSQPGNMTLVCPKKEKEKMTAKYKSKSKKCAGQAPRL
jgi:hypothetical protein